MNRAGAVPHPANRPDQVHTMGLLHHLQTVFQINANAALNQAEEPAQVFDYS
jgi:hypothetical protein